MGGKIFRPSQRHLRTDILTDARTQRHQRRCADVIRDICTPRYVYLISERVTLPEV